MRTQIGDLGEASDDAFVTSVVNIRFTDGVGVK